jgi:hypothetical protein
MHESSANGEAAAIDKAWSAAACHRFSVVRTCTYSTLRVRAPDSNVRFKAYKAKAAANRRTLTELVLFGFRQITDYRLRLF